MGVIILCKGYYGDYLEADLNGVAPHTQIHNHIILLL